MKKVQLEKYTKEKFYSLTLDLGEIDIESLIDQTSQSLTNNDRYVTYKVNHVFTGTLFTIDNPTGADFKNKDQSFVTETFEDYQKKMVNLKENNYKWILNIIEGISEVDRIIYRNENFICIPDIKFNNENLDNLHILAISANISLRTLRELNQSNLSILYDMIEKTYESIEKKYGIERKYVKAFIHYPPSFYVLHIHFMNVKIKDSGTSFERCHDVNRVIENIERDDKYYKRDMIILE
jgi:hypothetical protein